MIAFVKQSGKWTSCKSRLFCPLTSQFLQCHTDHFKSLCVGDYRFEKLISEISPKLGREPVTSGAATVDQRYTCFVVVCNSPLDRSTAGRLDLTTSTSFDMKRHAGQNTYSYQRVECFARVYVCRRVGNYVFCPAWRSVLRKPVACCVARSVCLFACACHVQDRCRLLTGISICVAEEASICCSSMLIVRVLTEWHSFCDDTQPRFPKLHYVYYRQMRLPI